MARRYVSSDPTANKAIGNITREGKVRAPREKSRRRIVHEFPEIFNGLSEAQKVTITLSAAKIAGAGDAWGITAEHLELAKVEYFRSGR